MRSAAVKNPPSATGSVPCESIPGATGICPCILFGVDDTEPEKKTGVSDTETHTKAAKRDAGGSWQRDAAVITGCFASASRPNTAHHAFRLDAGRAKLNLDDQQQPTTKRRPEGGGGSTRTADERARGPPHPVIRDRAASLAGRRRRARPAGGRVCRVAYHPLWRFVWPHSGPKSGFSGESSLDLLESSIQLRILAKPARKLIRRRVEPPALRRNTVETSMVSLADRRVRRRRCGRIRRPQPSARSVRKSASAGAALTRKIRLTPRSGEGQTILVLWRPHTNPE